MQRWCLFGIGGLADRPYTDPMKPATLLAVLVPLLFGGCGEKESVAEVRAVEEKQQEVKPEEPVTENKPADAGDKHGNPTGYNVAWSDWEY